jgi:hypothetical protein
MGYRRNSYSITSTIYASSVTLWPCSGLTGSDCGRKGSVRRMLVSVPVLPQAYLHGKATRFAAALTLLLLNIPAWPHEAIENNIYLTIVLEESELVYELDAPTFLLPPLADIAFGDEFPTLAQRQQALKKFFSQHCPMRIDDLSVLPVVDELSLQEAEEAPHQDDMLDFVSARVVLRYPLKTAPARIDMTWAVFAEEPPGVAQEEHSLDELLAVSPYSLIDGKESFVIFSPAEPQFVWHRPATLPPLIAVAESATAPWELPRAVPIGLALLGLGLLPWRRQRLRLIGGLSLVAGIAAAVWKPVLPPPPALPSAKEAGAHFARLHANVYRAFDYDEEDAIYDALAQSVDGPLLERLYIQIYQGLILRDEGGAVAKVHKVEIQAQDVRLPVANSANPVIEVDCTWRVQGYVSHWQHTHRRTNEYEASYAMRRVAGTWKIADVRTTRQERIYAVEPE